MSPIEIVASAQSNHRFYAVVYDFNASKQGLGQSIVFRVDAESNTKQEVWSLMENTSLNAIQHLPQREQSFLETARKGAIGVTTDPLNTRTITQNVQGFWELSQEYFLVLIANSVCYGTACGGFYSFHTLESTTGVLTLLSKLDYHESVLSKSQTCSSEWAKVHIADVILNPVKNQFAYTIKGDRNCVNTFGYTKIVNFEVTPATETLLDWVTGAKWSPQGTTLAYYRRDSNCSLNACDLTILTTSVQTITSSQNIIKQGPIHPDILLFLSWISENSIAYSWQLPPANSETPSVIILRNLLNQIETVYESPSGAMFEGIVAIPSGTTLLLANDGKFVSVGTGGTVPIQTQIPDVTSWFGNERIRTSFLGLSANKTVVKILQSDLSYVSINLEPLLPISSLPVIWISPSQF